MPLMFQVLYLLGASFASPCCLKFSRSFTYKNKCILRTDSPLEWVVMDTFR